MEKYFTSIIEDLIEETTGFIVSKELIKKTLQQREFIGLGASYITAFKVLEYLKNDYEYTSNQYFLKLAKEKYPKKKKSIYDLGVGDSYWYIANNGTVIENNVATGYDKTILEARLVMRNTFLTEQEAIKERDKRQATARIERALTELGCELGFIRDEGNYYFLYSFIDRDINCNISSTLMHNGLYFTFKDDFNCKEFIRDHETDIKLMLGVE